MVCMSGAGAGAGAAYSRVWLDIEQNPSAGCGWSTDLAQNCAFIAELVRACVDTGVACGIYASHYEWGAVAGAACSAGKALPLWYAHYDHNSSCADYAALPFGGWSAPQLKQYDDKIGGGCGPGADVSARC